MQARVQRVIDDRTLMLAAISHDLRTPLTRIRLAAETSQASSLRPELVANIEEMEMMIEASLHFASENAVSEVFRKTDVAVMVMSLCDDLNDRHGKAEYRGPEHAVLACQPLALKRALNNVIENAWKFAGEAIVELTDEPDIVRLEVRDFGPGIPQGKVDAAFAPFGRLESAETQKPGSGLGLTIARDVIRAHGGEVALEPNEPVGLVVRIHIPRPI
jgi:signal transduction histidine kinase